MTSFVYFCKLPDWVGLGKAICLRQVESYKNVIVTDTYAALVLVWILLRATSVASFVTRPFFEAPNYIGL